VLIDVGCHSGVGCFTVRRASSSEPMFAVLGDAAFTTVGLTFVVIVAINFSVPTMALDHQSSRPR
jgi:hypothetical protein